MSGWKNPPWWPMANLHVCVRDACGDFLADESDPDVCLRCGIIRAEHPEAAA